MCSLASCFAEASHGLPELVVPPIPRPSACLARYPARAPVSVPFKTSMDAVLAGARMLVTNHMCSGKPAAACGLPSTLPEAAMLACWVVQMPAAPSSCLRRSEKQSMWAPPRLAREFLFLGTRSTPTPGPYASSSLRPRRSVADLPAEVLEGVVARLGARDAVRLGAACRGFRALAAEAMPGLLLSLYPHQV